MCSFELKRIRAFFNKFNKLLMMAHSVLLTWKDSVKIDVYYVSQHLIKEKFLNVK